MHIIIAALSAIAGLLWVLYRLHNSGVNLNAFNPFHWMRRREWEKKLSVKPLHRLDMPMEAAAVLVVATVRSEGEVSREQKQETIKLFEAEFHLDNLAATELFSESAFLLKDAADIVAEVKHILAPSKEKFTHEQSQSTVNLLRRVSLLDGVISTVQQQLLDAVSSELIAPSENNSKWS